jgi:hypothetical protein
MATETVPSEALPQKLSRYRSVRRVQAQQAEQHQPPPIPTMPPMPLPPLPPIESTTPNDSPISRSRSRYHRRPTISNAPPAKGPPLRSATIPVPPPPTAPEKTTIPRYRALSSPQAPGPSNVQPRVPSAPHARDTTPTASSLTRPRTARDEAKQLIQDEAERYRRIKERQEAERRDRLRGEHAERERQEQTRREEEDDAAQRVWAEQEAEEAAEARRQQEEKERGKRLHKTESAKRVRQRSPPVSPPRHAGGFSMFRRRHEGGHSSPKSPPNEPSDWKPPQTSHGDRDMDNIKAGGGGAVLGIDAPLSAVNAGDRVRFLPRVQSNLADHIVACYCCLQQKEVPPSRDTGYYSPRSAQVGGTMYDRVHQPRYRHFP